MKLQISRLFTTVVAQAAVNVTLALLLYNEYIHNTFMQEYLAGFWAANTISMSLSLVAAGIATGGFFFVFSRREPAEEGLKPSPRAQLGVPGGLVSLDVCPFCNLGLASLSEGRFQCRKCRRYFKK